MYIRDVQAHDMYVHSVGMSQNYASSSSFMFRAPSVHLGCTAA